MGGDTREDGVRAAVTEGAAEVHPQDGGDTGVRDGGARHGDELAVDELRDQVLGRGEHVVLGGALLRRGGHEGSLM